MDWTDEVQQWAHDANQEQDFHNAIDAVKAQQEFPEPSPVPEQAAPMNPFVAAAVFGGLTRR